MKILFVCTGNTCRSPMAQYLAQKKTDELKLNIQCESAGVYAFQGDSPSENSVEAMKKYGIDISDHRARRFSAYMAEEYDLFVTMTREHQLLIENYVDKDKIVSFDIPDPYGLGSQTYEECADRISSEIDKLIEKYTFIERMSAEHISSVAQIERQCFSDPWSEEGLSTELSNEGAFFYVYTCFGRVLGYMGMHVVLDECYIANVAVLPGYRRKGIGESLVNFCTEKARQEGCSFISLEVRVSNSRAIALYKKAGFEEVGERKNFYSHPTENGLIMTKVFSEE